MEFCSQDSCHFTIPLPFLPRYPFAYIELHFKCGFTAGRLTLKWKVLQRVFKVLPTNLALFMIEYCVHHTNRYCMIDLFFLISFNTNITYSTNITYK